MSDGLQITPAMIQPRGEFPEHTDRPRAPLTAEQARARAYWRLKQWRVRRDIGRARIGGGQ